MDNVYSTPDAELVDPQKQNIHIFPRFSAWFVFLLQVVTLGLYGVYWLFTRSKMLNLAIEHKMSIAIIQVVFAFTLISVGVSFADIYFQVPEQFDLATSLFDLAISITTIVLNFQFRNRLGDHFMNGRENLGPILTFFFGPLYLQYKINEEIDVNS